MAIPKCPNCDTQVFVGSDAEEGDTFMCPGCNLELELVWLNPPELDYFWDYDEDEVMSYDDFDDTMG